jgi:hypothetical protein
VDGTSIWAGDGVHLQRQQGRRQETHGGPDQGRRRGRTGGQENQTGVSRTGPCACQKKGGGKGTAIADAAPTLPATAALAIRSAAALPPWAWSRPPKPFPYGGRTGAGQPARRLPRGRSWPQRAAQGRPARPLGPLVTYGEDSEQKKK